MSSIFSAHICVLLVCRDWGIHVPLTFSPCYQNSFIRRIEICDYKSFDVIDSITCLFSWEEVVEQHFALQLPKKKLEVMPADEEAVDKLRQVPTNWTIESEEALVRLMSQHIPPENDHLGSIKNYVEAIDVSSCCVSTCNYMCNYKTINLYLSVINHEHTNVKFRI